MKRVGPAVLTLAALAATAFAYEPLSHYTVQTIEGWKVYVHNGLLGKGEHAEVGTQALKKLQIDLAAVKTLVPDRPLEELLKVPIWLEVDTTNGPHGRTPVFHYHPGADWLKKMDFHPAKHQCVEFSRAAAYANRAHREVGVVFHELAHAYHDRVLGFDDPEVLAAYNRAVAGTAYPPRDWARSNKTEFFCAVTQRYFGHQEERDQLKERDPQVVELLKRIWGEPKRVPPPPPPRPEKKRRETAADGKKEPAD
ncbi:MAG: hypothetical protein AMK72_09835 [Planctomycetes bacterium SM23_25]|nr:MAG: hypothetical protein AMK72_09835 [Planctomycetes bacterium SM23_25]